MKSSTTSSSLAFTALWLAFGSPALAQSGGAAAAPASQAAAPQAAAKPAAPAPTPGMPSFTAEQQQKIDALRTKTQAQLAPLQTKLATRREELRALWAAEKPDRATILRKVAEVDKLRQQMQEVRVDQELAFRALLTPEQQAARRGARPGVGPHGPGMGGMGMDHGHGHGMGPGGMGGHNMGMGECMDADACQACSDCGAAGGCTFPLPPPAAKPAEKAPPRG